MWAIVKCFISSGAVRNTLINCGVSWFWERLQSIFKAELPGGKQAFHVLSIQCYGGGLASGVGVAWRGPRAHGPVQASGALGLS